MFTIAKAEEGPPRPKGVSEEARRFLDKCLAFDPAKRPTAAELLQVGVPGSGPALPLAWRMLLDSRPCTCQGGPLHG
jgi:serine/threonine protein kinase